MDLKRKILTWHIHGNYLYNLSFVPHDFYLPVDYKRSEGYAGKTKNFNWRENVREIKDSEVKKQDFDLIIFQSLKNYLKDQYEILSEKQRQLPKIYLEHDPPRRHPTDTLHPATGDPSITIVHVTKFNNLMWDNGKNETAVVEHGIKIPKVNYKGDKNKGITIINNLKNRGRRLGFDIFDDVRREVPLDLAGINSKEIGGLGEVPFYELIERISHYRFFFSPIRYTSLGLAICEAMMVGLPIVGLAATELAGIIEDGVQGFIGTDINSLVEKMKLLLSNPELAKKMGENARILAKKRFNIERFASDWNKIIGLKAKKGKREMKKENNKNKQILLSLQKYA